MPYPLAPYVTEVASALTAAGHTVTETWTEATDPIDHNIAVQVGRSSLVLIWDGSRPWTWISYPSPSSTYSGAGDLAPHDATTADVVAAIEQLIARPIF